MKTETCTDCGFVNFNPNNDNCVKCGSEYIHFKNLDNGQLPPEYKTAILQYSLDHGINNEQR